MLATECLQWAMGLGWRLGHEMLLVPQMVEALM